MRLWPARKSEDVERGGYSFPISPDQYASYFSFNNNIYPYGVVQTYSGDREQPYGNDFSSLVDYAYKSNGVVFACMLARQLLFSEPRFQWRPRRNGRPGVLFGNQDLAILETPAPGHTTRDLLSQAITDADLAGNWFGARDGDQIRRLRPDWVDIVLGSNERGVDSPAADGKAILEYDAEVIGYLYYPGGRNSGYDPRPFHVDQVAHFKHTPDPSMRFRGMSWLTPVIREIQSDSAATRHKQKFFEQGATANMIVKVPEGVRKEAFENMVELFKGKHEGLEQAYKTIFLTSGADATVVGSDFQQMDFKVTQGAGETRIAAAARMHPVIVGLSEGLQGSSLNAGNFNSARRLVADATLRPLWGNMAGSLARIVPYTGNGTAELWYDDRDISFLQEDFKDRGQIQQFQAVAIKTLVDAGFDPQAVVDAIDSDDLSRLQHTGLVSVQLQEPGVTTTASNGSGTMPAKLPLALPKP